MTAIVPADINDISEADTLQRRMTGSPRQRLFSTGVGRFSKS
jgi:hypothetical protein